MMQQASKCSPHKVLPPSLLHLPRCAGKKKKTKNTTQNRRLGYSVKSDDLQNTEAQKIKDIETVKMIL